MGVLIIAKSFVVRETMESIFKSEFNFINIKAVSYIYEVSEIELNKYDFIFMEIDKENLVDIQNMITCKKILDNTKLLVLDKDKNWSIFNQVINLGVDGYMHDVYDKEDIIFAIKRVMCGKTFYDSELIETLLSKSEDLDLSILTSRENSVLELVAQGLGNNDIANNLCITEYTVKKHVSSILNKLNLKSRQGVIVYCRDNYSKV